MHVRVLISLVSLMCHAVSVRGRPARVRSSSLDERLNSVDKHTLELLDQCDLWLCSVNFSPVLCVIH